MSLNSTEPGQQNSIVDQGFNWVGLPVDRQILAPLQQRLRLVLSVPSTGLGRVERAADWRNSWI
jgi:hypothetical protein